ncbi:hypothetical protein D3C71_1574840 [compost metagenome]
MAGGQAFEGGVIQAGGEAGAGLGAERGETFDEAHCRSPETMAARRKSKTRVYSRALRAFLLVHQTSGSMLARGFSRDNPVKNCCKAAFCATFGESFVATEGQSYNGRHCLHVAVRSLEKVRFQLRPAA